MNALPVRVIAALISGFVGLVLVMSFFAILHRYRVNDGPLPYAGFAVGAIVGWIGVGRFPALRGASAAKHGPPLLVEERGEWTHIYARPRPLPARITVVSWVAAVVPAVAAAFWVTSGTSNPRLPMFVFIIVVFLALIAGAISKFFGLFHNAGRKAQRHGFDIGAAGVRLHDGTLIPSAVIARVTITNAMDGRVVAVGGFNATAGVAQMGMTTQRLIAAVSFVVNLEHEGQRTILAGGLDDALAHAVMREVTRRVPGFAM